LVTSGIIIIFWAISQLTIYHYFKTDYYAAIVAVSFLGTGILVARSKASKNTDKSLLPDLTQKELTILALIAEGKSNKDIAAENFVELSTVKTHINNIYAKLGVTSRREAIKVYSSHRE
ncbi:MAG TPA: helix-turn-helix transcriptional regulator, partial [Mucilaginibacter sp.]|nr:helix-turn-helix transcriptional regulator [Mucilaginibacter sp.]